MNINDIIATGTKATRDGFGPGLLELGRQNPNVVGLTADLMESLQMQHFQKEFPERFFQVGIAEANMIGIAAGLATGGKIPFTGTFANFSTGRVYDQIRQSIAYSHKNVKICFKVPLCNLSSKSNHQYDQRVIKKCCDLELRIFLNFHLSFYSAVGSSYNRSSAIQPCLITFIMMFKVKNLHFCIFFI